MRYLETRMSKGPSGVHFCHFLFQNSAFLSKGHKKLGNLRWVSGVSFVVTSVHFWKNDPISGSMRR